MGGGGDHVGRSRACGWALFPGESVNYLSSLTESTIYSFMHVEEEGGVCIEDPQTAQQSRAAGEFSDSFLAAKC